MKVSKLISELKKLPKNLDVGVAMHDNTETEVAGWVSEVFEIVEGGPQDYMHPDDYGKKCVVLRC